MPSIIGRFQIHGRLGEGGFGTVYRAYDPHLEREVALKVARPDTLHSAQRVQRFLGDARAAARLRHPHIVPVHDAGRDGELYFIASALIEGRSLASAIASGDLTQRQAVQIVQAVAEALAYAHAQGIVHRDIKPDNIMLDGDDQPHLIDFGLAQRQDLADDREGERDKRSASTSARHTLDGAVLGTASYISPEQAAGHSREASPAMDQYSLGVTLYELLCGKTPFAGPQKLLLYHAVHTPPPSPRSLKPQLSLDLEAICLRTLAKTPDQRYANCQALADDLRRWLEGDPVSVRPLPLAERFWRWCRHEPKLTAAIGAAVGFLLLAAVIAVFSAAHQHHLQIRATEARKVAQHKGEEAEAAWKHAEERQKALQATLLELKDLNQVRQQQVVNLGQATTAKELALQEKEQALVKVETALKAEQLAHSELARSNETIRQGEYFYLTALAGRELQAGNLPAVAQLLPRASADLRGWEWHHLQHRRDQVQTLQKRLAQTQRLAFNQAETTLARAGPGRQVRLWNFQAGREAIDAPLTTLDHEVSCVTWGKGGLLACGTVQGQIQVWNVAVVPPRLLRDHLAHPNRVVTCLHFRPDGAKLATAGSDGTILIWDISTGARETGFVGHPEPVRTVYFTPTLPPQHPLNGTLYSISHDNVVQLWKIDNPATPVQTLRGYTCGAFSGDGRRGTLARENGTVLVTDILTGEPLWVGPGQRETIHTLAFTRDGQRLAQASLKRTLIWKNGQPVRQLSGTTALSLSPTGQWLAYLGGEGLVRLVAVESGKTVLLQGDGQTIETATRLDGYRQHIAGLTLHPQGKLLATAASLYDRRELLRGEVKIWSFPAGEERRVLLQEAETWALAFLPGEKHLLSAGKQGKIQAWDVETGTAVFHLDQGSEVWCLATTASGLLASGGKEGKLYLWDVKTRQCRQLPAHERGLAALAVSKDGQFLVSGGWDGAIKVWNPATAALVRELPTQSREVDALAFSPDGRWLASGSADGVIQLWSVIDWRKLRTLARHTRRVVGLAFSPDGKRLASAGEDRTVRLWDVDTGQEALALPSETTFSSPLVFSRDGRHLIAGTAEGVSTWEAPREK